MSFPRYPTYKDSGVEWLGQVPEHWGIDDLKHRCEVFPSNIDKKVYEDQTPVLLCNYTDVYYNDVIESGLEFMAATASQQQIDKFSLRAGDTIITKDSEARDDIGISAFVPSDLPGIVCGYHLTMIRPRDGAAGAFVKRLFDAKTTKAHLEVSANGLTRVGLGQYTIDNLSFAWPPLDEQSAIATFLDRETAKIDALVVEQEKLIELLKEKRQAVISHAVTKGLDPSVPMKDSGVEWLGEVPAHWEVTGLKRLCHRITDGAHISPETVGGVHFFVSTKDIIDDSIDFENCLLTTESSFEYLVRTGCKPASGDVLFSKDGTIGRTVVVNTQADFVVASSLIIITPDVRVLDSQFLNYLCKSNVIVQQVEGFVKGAGLPRLSIQNLLKVIGVFPPLSEQLEIVSLLTCQTTRMNSLIRATEFLNTLLQERRSALISAAVTGQIDVRQHAS